MTRISLLATVATALVTFSGCSENEDIINVDPVTGAKVAKTQFAISLPKDIVGAKKTRMSADNVQYDETVASFRGMDNIHLYSFDDDVTTTSTALGSIIRLSAISRAGLADPEQTNFYVYNDQFIPIGTTNFLLYAKAVDNSADEVITTPADKFRYGYITHTGLDINQFKTVNDIRFSLESICTDDTPCGGSTVGLALIDLLNSVASVPGWSTSTNEMLKKNFDLFITLTAGSSTAVQAALGELYSALSPLAASIQVDADVAQAICNVIKDACAAGPVGYSSSITLSDKYQGYPAGLNLPVGAGKVTWDGTQFVAAASEYGKHMEVKQLSEYVYPASLYYQVNSPLRASNEVKSGEYEAKEKWSEVINSVYEGSELSVSASTQSVALANQVQYAVGRLDTRITMKANDYYDSKGAKMDVTKGFTLMGMLIGGQKEVAYNWKPVMTSVQHTIYDREINGDVTALPGKTSDGENYTLGLETKTDVPVNVALEFVNNGPAFQGADGMIPAGGTFYLTAKLDPLATTTTNYQAGTIDRIFIQDYATKVNITLLCGNADLDGDGEPDLDRDGDGTPDKYIDTDGDGIPDAVDTDGDGDPDPYDYDGDGNPDVIIVDPDNPDTPGWDTDGDGVIDYPIDPDDDTVDPIPDGPGTGTNGVPDLDSPGLEFGTSVNLHWENGLHLNPQI
ncbi:MAG: hypothetical protein K5683_07265 [Prevotella sp.]|nr:hypothetical protein [Prevotella sp.]